MNTYIQLSTLALFLVQHGVSGQGIPLQCPNLYDMCLTGPSTTYVYPKANSLNCWGKSQGENHYYCFQREKCESDEVDLNVCSYPEQTTYYSCPGITDVCNGPGNKKFRPIDTDVPQCWRIEPGKSEWECMHRPGNGCGATWTYLDSQCKYEKPVKKPECPNYFAYGWRRGNPTAMAFMDKSSPRCWGRRPDQIYYDLADKSEFGGSCPDYLIDADTCKFITSDKQECLDSETECTDNYGKVHKLKDENTSYYCWIQKASGGYDCAIGPRNSTCPTGSQFSCAK